MQVEQITSEVLAEGHIIRKPPGSGKGYWAGAPGVYFDKTDSLFYLSYRLRRPRGIIPDRGAETRIAISRDGITFDDIWSLKKDSIQTPSIERCLPYRNPHDGQWQLFLSYVDPTDRRWCISVLKARSIEQFDPKMIRRLFSASELGLEGIKDPWIFEYDGMFYMLVSVAIPTSETSEQSHATYDIFNTGQCLSATGLATSSDLEDWQWKGVVFKPSDTSWDYYCRRINSVIFQEGEFWGFYDGGKSYRENYEEKTGIASSPDMKNWQCLSCDAPVLVSPHSSNCLRYLDAHIIDNRAYLYYELARPDGAHELRAICTTPLTVQNFLKQVHNHSQSAC